MTTHPMMRANVVPRTLPGYRDQIVAIFKRRVSEEIENSGSNETPQVAERVVTHDLIWNATLYYGTTDFCDLLEDALSVHDHENALKFAGEPGDPDAKPRFVEAPVLLSTGLLYFERPLPFGLIDPLVGTDAGEQFNMVVWGPILPDTWDYIRGDRGGPVDGITNLPVWLGLNEQGCVTVAGTGSPALEIIGAILGQPGITTSTTERPRPGVIRRAIKAKLKPPPDVTVIDLRKSVAKGLADVAEAERTYQHRWIVRGHWRDQAHGKGRTQRRHIYIAPHIKGPDGAPMMTGEKVYKW